MRVMVVIHEPGRRHGVSEFLRQRGYEVQVPQTPHEVVHLASETQPEVVVLDMYVSNPNGLELLRQLRGVGYAGRVVALAGKSLRTVQRDALSWGVHQVVGGLQAAEGFFDPAPVEAAVRSCLKAEQGGTRPRMSAD